MMPEEDRFNFQQCWTCKNLIYDVELRKHRCPETGRIFEKREVAEPTACQNWKRV